MRGSEPFGETFNWRFMGMLSEAGEGFKMGVVCSGNVIKVKTKT